MNKLKIFYTALVIFFINLNYVLADNVKPFCSELIDKIKENQIDMRLDLPPLTFDWGVDHGIDFHWNSNYEYERNEDGYLTIFNVRYQNSEEKIFDAFDKIASGDIVTHINGGNINDMSKSDIDDILFPEVSDDINSTEDINTSYDLDLIVLKKDQDYKETNIKIKPYYNVQNWIYPEVYIENFRSIDSKRGIFELNLTLYYYWENPDLVPIYEELLSEYEIEYDQYNLGYCQVPYDEFESMHIWHPMLDFQNIAEESLDEARDDYIIEYYPEDEDINAKVYNTYQWVGNTTLTSKFNFKAFPFDTQVLSLELTNFREEIPIEQKGLKSSFIESDFEKKLQIPDWKIVSKDIIPSHYISDYHYGEKRSMTSLQLRIERNYFYYVYKILIPIFIILIVAWSALWIKPEHLEARLTITIICLLSLIAYNFIVDKDLPKLEYLSLMDYIILISYLFAAVPTIFSVIAFNYHQKDSPFAIRFDNTAKFYGPIVFAITVLAICIIIFSQNSNTAMFIRSIQGF